MGYKLDYIMSTQKLTFDEWCDNLKIRGNFREALFHHLCAKYTMEKINELGDLCWKQEWDILLDELLKRWSRL